MSLQIADEILENALVQKQIEKLQKKRTKGPYVNDTTKSKLRNLPIEILVNNIYPLLHSPDLICLALTCKELAAKVLVVGPSVDDNVPIVVVKTYGNGIIQANQHSGHREEKDTSFLCLTSRKQLLCQLSDYFPRGYQLCWICNQYFQISSCRSHSVWLKSDKAPWNHKLLINRMFPRRVYCHHNCKSNFVALRRYANETLGAGYFNTDYHPMQARIHYAPRTPAPPNSYVLCHEENALAYSVDGGAGPTPSPCQWYEKWDGLWVQRTFITLNYLRWEPYW